MTGSGSCLFEKHFSIFGSLRERDVSFNTGFVCFSSTNKRMNEPMK